MPTQADSSPSLRAKMGSGQSIRNMRASAKGRSSLRAMMARSSSSDRSRSTRDEPETPGREPETPDGRASTSRWSTIDNDKALDAKRKLAKWRTHSSKTLTNDTYAACLSLRSLPYTAFLDGTAPTCPMPISSINEDKLLVAFGLPRSERNQIEDLQRMRRAALVTSPTDHEGAQFSASALARLAANPPPTVGKIQRRTSGWLLRPFPLGLRFSGQNMSPLPGWLAGAHSIALNMSNCDLPLHLHFALFNGSGGFVLKPAEMVTTGDDDAEHQSALSVLSSPTRKEALCWPRPRKRLHRTSIDVISLHYLPKVRALGQCCGLSFGRWKPVIS